MGARFAVIDLPIVVMIKNLFSKNGGGGTGQPFRFVTIEFLPVEMIVSEFWNGREGNGRELSYPNRLYCTVMP